MVFTPSHYLIESALPQAVVGALRELAQELKLVPGRETPDAGPEVTRTRRALMGFFAADHWVSGVMYHFAALANARSWRFNLAAPSPSQYTVYSEEGHTDWHSDYVQSTKNQNAERKVTAIMNISRDVEFTGGELELRPDWADPNAQPVKLAGFWKPGAIALFPSLTPYRVGPVKGGERLTITSWMIGPPLK